MAEKSLVIRILGDTSQFKSSLLSIAPTLGVISGAALLFGKNAVGAFEEADQVSRQLGAVLTSTAGAAGVTREQVESLSTSLSRMTGIDDEAITGAQSMLLTFTNIGKEVFPETTQAVVDMATFMNNGAIPSMEQLTSTAQLIGKALQDPVEGLQALQRNGVRLTESQKDLIKSLVETGKTAEAQKIILQELEKRYAGAGKAAGESFAGGIAKARVEAGNFNEEAGQMITSVLGPIMQAFPDATTAIIGTSDALAGMNITTGDMLIAGPKLIEMLGGWSGALAVLGSTAAVVATAFAAWEIGRMVGEIEIFGVSIDSLTESLAKNLFFSKQISSAMDENEVAINRVAGLLKSPIVRQAGEDWKHYADRVLEAAKNEAQSATAAAQAAAGITKVSAAAKSHVITLAQQIEKQKALVDSLSKQVGKDKELTEATDKLAAMQKKQSEASGKATKEVEAWGSALGVTIPRLKQTVAEGEKYVAYLKKAKPGSEELREAEQKLSDARLALTKATSPLIRETQKLLQATKDLDKVQIDNAETHKAAVANAKQLTDKLHSLGLVAGVELPAEFGKPKTALLDLEASFKTLGITSSKVLGQQVTETRAAYESIRDSGKGSARDIALAWAAMAQAQIDATRATGGKIDYETERTVEKIKSKYGELKNDNNANLTTWRELASKQVSTLVSDVSKGFADILVAGGSFGSKIINMFKQIGQGMLQAFFESGIGGLLSGKGFGGFGGFISGLIDGIKGLKGGGGVTSLAGLIPGLGGKGGLLAGLGGLGALGIGGGGLIAGGVAGGSLASIAAAGTVPGFLLAGGTVAGTAGAAGVGSGLAAGGAGAAAGGGGLLGSIGALATNPFTIAAAAALGGVLLTRRLTRRGREKEEATGAAEDLRDTVWQDIIPAVQSGQKSVEDGIAAVQGAWDAYVQFLHENIKDQTVVQRSIEGQKVTLTEGLAAIEALQAKETEVAAKRNELEGLVKQFTETGVISSALSDMVKELGGNLEAFSELSKISGLKDLQAQFGGIRAELEKMGPTAEDLYGNFIQTGEITDALRSKIEELGGSASIFEQFSGIKSMKADFESLSASILSTGQGMDQIRPIFEQMRVSVGALDAAAALPGLQGLRGEFGSLLSQINQLLPATKSWQEQFLQTGIITDDMRKKIAEAGGDLSVFNKAAGEISAGGLSAGTANIVATELGKMTKGLDEQIADLQKGLTEALEEVGTRLDAQFEDSRTALLAQLDLLDSSLSTSIGSLQTALQAEVSNLTAAISGIKIPSEITVNVEQQPAAPTSFETPTQPDQTQQNYDYGAQAGGYQGAWDQGYQNQYGYAWPGYAMAEGGEGWVNKPTMFLAGEAGREHFKFTPARAMDEPRLIPQAMLERIQSSMPQSMQQNRTQVNTTTVDNSRKIEPMTINLYGGGRDPFEEQKQLDLYRTRLISSLA